MTLDEALKQCTESVIIGIRVGDKEARIKFRPEGNCYSLEENRPWALDPPQPCRIIGESLTKEEVKVRVSDISFASEMDPKGWLINPHRV